MEALRKNTPECVILHAKDHLDENERRTVASLRPEDNLESVMTALAEPAGGSCASASMTTNRAPTMPRYRPPVPVCECVYVH